MENNDQNRGHACWIATRAAAELSAMAYAATGRYGWAIATKGVVLLADLIVACFRGRR